MENWRKHTESIKLLTKKRARKSDDKSSRILQTKSVNTEQETPPSGQLKRHNPFGCSASKKANITKPCENGENIKLFNAIDKPVSKNITSTSAIPKEPAFVSDVLVLDQSKNIDSSINEDDASVCVKQLSGKQLPIDWSLKTRVRLTSSQSFNWCSKILGKQEARGLSGFVQTRETIHEDSCTNFQQNIMYWMHPTLPWLPLFPRLSSDVQLTSKVPNVAENQGIGDALQTSCSQSFYALYNLLRCNYCDYFYLCLAQFTVLFRAVIIGGVTSTSAFITPTSKGIREGFEKAGKCKLYMGFLTVFPADSIWWSAGRKKGNLFFSLQLCSCLSFGCENK